MLVDWLTLSTSGFSMICGAVLLAAYVWSPVFPKKTAYAIGAATLLTLILGVLQWHHMAFALGGSFPLEMWSYRIPLFLGPFGFFLLGRAVALPDRPFHPWLLLHAVPVLLPVGVPMTIALPLLFSAGCAYAIWLGGLVYRARERRPQRRFEAAFSLVVIGSALAVLTLGITLPWVASVYFVVVYATSVAVAYAMIAFALVAIPDFVQDLFEVTQARYGVSTLNGVDVAASVARLQKLMDEDRLYEQSDITLASVAEVMAMSPHQLSELVNSQIGIGFSRYINRKRLVAARELLRTRPQQSVLSIALEVGFRSQSTFYAAFKSEYEQSPGDYRSNPCDGAAGD